MAEALGKELFILKQANVTFKSGILGDHEYIPFPAGQLSKAFVPILQGLNGLFGDRDGLVLQPATWMVKNGF